MRESFRHNQEINELLQKQEELQERLTEEARAREDLALELHRAEGDCSCIYVFISLAVIVCVIFENIFIQRFFFHTKTVFSLPASLLVTVS